MFNFSLETQINLSVDLYDIFPTKIDHLKPVDMLLFLIKKTMYLIWGDNVQNFILVSSDLWFNIQRFLTILCCKGSFE